MGFPNAMQIWIEIIHGNTKNNFIQAGFKNWMHLNLNYKSSEINGVKW